MSYEFLIGLRYTRAKRRNHFISFISFASMIGIALGVAVLILVLSVMNGFQKEVRDRMLSVVAHIEIIGFSGQLKNWQTSIEAARKHASVIGAAPFVATQAMLSYQGGMRGGLVRGISPEQESQVSDITQHIKAGQFSALEPGKFNIILGVDLARSLGVEVGDKVVVITPQGNVTPAGVIPRLKQFRVAALFQVGHAEYDSSLALIHLADAQTLLHMENDVTGIRLKTNDLYRTPIIAKELSSMLPAGAYLRDWSRVNRNWFAAVQIEKRMMFLILSLIVAIAAFNLVSSLVMAVTDKQADIAILRTLGAAPLSIMKIFMVQGSIVGFLGTFLGVFLGVVGALNVETVVPQIERLFSVQFLAKDIYFISELPSELQYMDVVFITVVSLVLSLVATLYPSYRAAKVNPADALRYE